MPRGKQKARVSYERNLDASTVAITPYEYTGLQEAFDHLNGALFGGSLPDVFITYQRRAHSYGYFAADRFSGRVGEFGKHELALNPDGFIGRSDKDIAATLLHEMVHLWQQVAGTPAARRYHDREWAAKMKAVGLQPSNTGIVGGKETGQHMHHYVIPGGAFDVSYEQLAATGWKLNLQSAHRPGPKATTNSKTKFTCGSCGQNAWGKPDLKVDCHDCGGLMLAADVRAEALVEAVATPSPEPEQPVAPVKPKRGRPKGSKNKPKPKRRGRPKGSKNKPKPTESLAA
jgi:hypothetical protein